MYRYLFLGLVTITLPLYAGAATAESATKLINPLKVDSIEGFFLAILDIMLTFAVPIVVLAIMYSGFMMVMAQGDATKLATARKRLYAAIVGGLVIFGARLILEIITSTIKSF